MRKLSVLLAGCLLTLSFAAAAKGGGHGSSHAYVVHVNGHTTKAGTYVPPHYRTGADDSKLNNWSTKGNVNPYSGKAGTRSPYGH